MTAECISQGSAILSSFSQASLCAVPAAWEMPELGISFSKVVTVTVSLLATKVGINEFHQG